MENHCPNCQKDLYTVSKKSTLNIINLKNLNNPMKHKYCSDQCVESKIKNTSKEKENKTEYFPFEIWEGLIKVFGKSKTDEYFIVVDL